MLNFNHLHYFHVAATAGSIAAAATELGVTQPTVSEQLRTLERALGVGLFERGPTGLRLTDAGRVVYEQTTVMFRASERLVEALARDATSALPSRLRVGLSPGVSRAVSTDFLMPLLALDSCVPELRTAEPLELLRELRDGGLDLGLVESEPTEAARRDLHAVAIDTIHMAVVASPEVTPNATWSDVALVHYRPSSPYHWGVETYLAEHGLTPRVAAEADDPAFLVEAVARGAFVAIVPRVVARDAILAGRVRELGRVEQHPITVYAVHADAKPGELVQRAVAALIARAKTLHD